VSDEIAETEALYLNLKEKRNVFTKNNALFHENLNVQIFEKLHFEMVIYDEIETFKEY
jgi:hypothetical protein